MTRDTYLKIIGAGAAIVGLGQFLPMADAAGPITGNSLIQHEIGILVLGLAAIALFRAYKTPGSIAVPILGFIITGLIIVMAATTDLLTLVAAGEPPSGSLRDTLEHMAYSEKADPGIGIYATALGGLVMASAAFIGSPSPQRQAERG